MPRRCKVGEGQAMVAVRGGGGWSHSLMTMSVWAIGLASQSQCTAPPERRIPGGPRPCANRQQALRRRALLRRAPKARTTRPCLRRPRPPSSRGAASSRVGRLRGWWRTRTKVGTQSALLRLASRHSYCSRCEAGAPELPSQRLSQVLRDPGVAPLALRFSHVFQQPQEPRHFSPVQRHSMARPKPDWI